MSHADAPPRAIRGESRLRRVAAALLSGRGLLALAVAAAILPFAGFLALDLLFPFPIATLRRPPALAVADRDGVPLRFFLPADGRFRLPVALAELPPELPRALVASEDRRFFDHGGVDPRAVLRAAWTDLKARSVVSGASTIPMQIARMAEPRPRTLWAKAVESFRALQLERRYGKRALLEIYLNLLPYGGNVEGVGAAAWAYFGKAPERLSLGEIALLTALPRAPLRYDPTLSPAAHRAAVAARDRVLAELAQRGAFPRRAIAAARREPVPEVRRRPPFAAPHACELVAARLGRGFRASGLAPGGRVRSTLDRRLQRAAEEQVARRIDDLRHQGIGEAAAVVVEIEPGRSGGRPVRALVGSAGFFDRERHGQVDGATSRRSPGSTLKPFLYALAIDEGRILPDSYLLDVPTDYAGYVPENYDQQYHGRVTVREALVHSLNAAAVRLLADVGLPDFLRLLHKGGLATLDRPAAEYGLPLVLGDGEVTLLDLTNLYATLAEGGLHRPARLLEDEGTPAAPAPPAADARLLSPGAAWAVAEILTDLRRPDLPDAWDITRGAPEVAWKTGTSYGHRDAWAVGWSGRYAIGVWVGNFDGRPVLGISGSQHAAPLLFDLFRAVERGGGAGAASAPRRPPGARLETIEVCAESHELPGPYCPRRVKVEYLPGRSRLPSCSYHRRALVDAATGELLTGECVETRPHAFRLLTVFPPELAAWARSEGQPVEDLPRLRAGCEGIPGGGGPRIVSPDAATAYRLRRDAPAQFQRIPLVAQAGPGTTRLFWYQDGVLVAANAPAEKLFLPGERGEHRLVVTDDLGRSNAVRYRVE